MEQCDSALILQDSTRHLSDQSTEVPLSDVLLSLTCKQYLTIIDASSGYHNLTLDQKSSYLTRLACQISRYRYAGLPIGTVPVGYMFLWKIDKIFKDISKIFGITDNILIVDCDESDHDHDTMLMSVIQICRTEDFRLNKGKCYIKWIRGPFFVEIISRAECSWTHRNNMCLQKCSQK